MQSLFSNHKSKLFSEIRKEKKNSSNVLVPEPNLSVACCILTEKATKQIWLGQVSPGTCQYYGQWLM